MNPSKVKGFAYGLATSITFGLIPLFTLPLMQKGLVSDSILFYRFLLATVALGGMMKLKREDFRIDLRDVPIIFFLSLLYTASALFLLWGYERMGAGVATTLHFTYPIFVTVMMFLLFRERTSFVTWLAIILAVCGVACLSLRGGEMQVDVLGVGIILLSAVGYASYIITVNKSRIGLIHNRKLAFYVFLFTTIIFTAKTGLTDGIQPVPDAVSWVNLVLLAVAPTVISNITLLLAIRHIGGTLTSILGAMEPVTAVAIGALIFGEAFSLSEALGIVMILTAVTLVILGNRISQSLSTLKKRIRPRHA